MRKIIFLVLGFLFITSTVFAHPPTNMRLRYDSSKKQLTVLLNHRTSKGGNSKRRKHYIEEVTLLLEDEVIDTKSFNFQYNESVVNVDFQIPEHEQDEIFTIEAKCSTGSKESKTFTAAELKDYQQKKKDSSY